MAKHHDNTEQILKKYRAMTFAFCLGTILSIVSFVSILNNNLEAIKGQFESQSYLRIALLKEKTGSLIQELSILSKYSEHITPKQGQKILSDLKENKFLSVIIVPENFNSSTNITIVEKDKKYKEELKNMPLLLRQLRKSQKRKELVSSPSFFIPGENKAPYAAIIFPLQGKKSKAGYLVVLINLQRFILDVFKNTNSFSEYTLELYDPKKSIDKSLFYYTHSNSRSRNHTPVRGKSMFSFGGQFSIFNHDYVVKVVPTNKHFSKVLDNSAWFVLLLGVVLTGFVGIFLYNLIGRNLKIEEVVNKRTSELDAVNKHLKSANKAKSEFLASVSHEIRTPLNGIIGTTELLTYTSLSEKQHRYVKRISYSGEMLLGTINDVLDISKIEAGKLNLEERKDNLLQTIQKTVDALYSSATEKDIEIVIQYPTDCPKEFYFDPVRIRQVLTNLIGNAIKFTDEGHVIIKVSIKKTKEYLVKIEVIDSGIGVPKKLQKHIFKKFSQADLSTTRRFGGTGLGLAICKKIIHLMKGEIGIISAPGQGSNFWFEIPLKPCKKKGEIKGKQKKTLSLQEAKIILVESRDITRKTVQDYLESWEADFESFALGGDALAFVENFSSSNSLIMILATELKDMTGKNFIKSAQKFLKKIDHRIILFGTADDIDIKNIKNCGFLVKPFTGTDLFLKITKSL